MAAPTVASVASNDGDSVDIVVSVPAGTANGDLLIAISASDWGTFAGNDVPAAFKTGTGGITLGTSDYDAGSNAVHIALGARIASSEPANYTFPHDSSALVSAIVRITGHDSTPVIAQVAPRTTGTGKEAPSIVPNGSDDLLLCIFAGEHNGSGAITWTPPSGMTEHVDRQSTIWTSLLVASLQSPSNPSGVKTATPSITVDTGAGCAIAIKAASSGTNLVIQDASLAISSDNIALTQVHSLVVADATLGTSSDNITLTQIIDLAIQKATMATRADVPSLSQVHQIVVHDAFLQTSADIVNMAGTSGGPMSVADLQAQKLPALTGKTGSVEDLLHEYYGGLSGLAPVAAFSTSDHQRAYYATQTGLNKAIYSFHDLEKAFYDQLLVPSGSLADRTFVYWTGL
jgi:hypothetical protein